MGTGGIAIDDCIENRIGMGFFQHRIYVAAGLAFGADAMEVLLLSFMFETLREEWNLERDEVAVLTSSVFIGAMAGTLILGALGDRIGRKPAFLLSSGLIAVFGLLSAVATSFLQFLLLRTMVGFGIGGLTIPFDVMAEFLPQSERGNKLLSLNYFWTFGTLLVVLAAYISKDNWRLLVVLTAVPCVISTIVGVCYVPESPRWLVGHGRNQEALAILRRAAEVNGHQNAGELFPADLKLLADEDEPITVSTCYSTLFEYKYLIFFLSLVWAGFGLLYYSTIILITLVFQGDTEGSNDDVNYRSITVSVMSEFVGVTLVILTIDRFGRVWSQMVTYLIGGIFVGLLCFFEASGSTFVLTAFAFGSRLGFMSASCVTWTATAELLPTSIRTTGHSIVNAVARGTGAISPFIVVQGETRGSYTIVGGILTIVSIVTIGASYMLPETKDAALGRPSTASTGNNTTGFIDAGEGTSGGADKAVELVPTSQQII